MYVRGGNSTVYDLGEEALVAGLDFSLYYYSYYAISSLTVSVSTDGETYTDVVTAEINENSTAIDFPETVSARYVKLTNSSSSAGYFRTMNIMGYVVAPQGFTYGGQKPAVVRDDVQEMTVPADNTSYQLLDLLDASYASTRTLKGNLLSGMTEADWIDAAYLAAQGTAPKGVKVLITDSASNPYEYPIEGPKLGQIEDTKLNVPAETVYANSQYSGEEGYRMFDGSAKSKWCGSEYGNWLVFELEEARVIGQWYTMHAGVEGNGMISAAFRLQTQNTEIVSEEDYLAMSESEKRTIARNASNWVDLDVVTGNTENEVTREIELDSLKQAQVYRFVVDEAAQPDGNSWGALRVYEMELYAYSGQLGANTNGLLKADVMDTYDVSYTKSKVEIANTTVTVRVPTVDEVIALIDAIGTPITVESRDAIKAARVAFDNLSEDDQKLVTNYETLEKAEADYLALADAVEALIDEIGYVTLESKAAIEAARAAYDALTDELKALVANYKTLLDAEQAYAYLTEVDTLVQQAEAAKADAESAKAAAEAAQAAAEAAQAAAEAAKAAAEAAAAQAGEDRAAAELAQEKAEAAQAKAEAAQAAAEAAKTQAEAAATAAEAAQAAAETAKAEAVAAAAEAAASAAAAAQDAAAAAASAEAAATSAAEAAEAAEAAQAAQAAAEAARAAAEAARDEAETAKAAAEDAAAQAGENREAAEAAQAKAEAAQAKAEEAQKKAEEAKAAAETAMNAAEASNKAAAAEAAKAAQEAAASAASAEAAAASAAAAAEAQAKAQAAQAAAEEAAKVAEEAQKKAEEAQKAAEEAAASSAENKENAEKAAQEAKEAQEAAEAARKAAEEAQAAAEAARDAAETANKEAAASAALAAEYAQKVAEAYAEIVEMKAEMAQYLAQAQKAAEEAEAAQKAAEEAQKKAEEAALSSAKYYALITLAQVDLTGCNDEQTAAAEAALAQAREAIDQAATPEEVETILEEALAAVEDAKALLCASELFTDVSKTAWYHAGVDFVINNGYMVGMSETEFGVNGSLTRGQLVTILYRLAGEPTVEGKTNPFTDVAENRYYTNAVIWGASEGIVNGITDTTFAPNQPVTREQIATFLYRYSGEPEVEGDNLAKFEDSGKVSKYAVNAMNWAVSQGLITGLSETTLSPNTTATRAQIATIIMRYLTAE